jgi:uncharacterized protein YqeY
MVETNLRQKLDADLKQALRSRDALRCSVIRMVLSAINYTEIAKQKKLDDGDILGVLAHEVKQRHESIDAYRKGNRADLVSKEEAELAILKEYQPQQMTREEVMAEAKKVIAEVGAQGIRDKGKVMARLMPQLKGKAEGQVINTVVTELLS